MKLFFCDICNESIPLQDIKDNRATTIKGKIFCRACNPLNELVSEPSSTAAGAPAQAASGGSSTMLYLGLVISLAASGYLLYDRQYGHEAQNVALAQRFESLETQLREAKQNASMIAGNVEGLNSLRALPKDLDDLREEAARTRGEIEKLSTGIAAAEKNLNTVGTLRERLEASVLKQDDLARRIERLDGAVDVISKQVREVSDRPPVLVTPQSPTAEPTAADPGAAPLDEKLLGMIEKLGSSDAMVRWEGIDQIRTAKEKSLIPHVMKLLSDRDTFVRVQAIYTLGELKATKAVPDLVKMLRDDEQMIREESLNALTEITGQAIKFDVNNKSEREKGIKRWDEWVAKNKDAL